MAQPIHCDGEGHREALADVIVSHLATGDTTAWCFDHYVEVCRAVVATVEAAQAEAQANAEADATAAEAARRLEGVEPGAADRDPETGFPFADTGPADGSGREAGPESLQEAVRGTEAGDSAAPAPEPTPDLDGASADNAAAPAPGGEAVETV